MKCSKASVSGAFCIYGACGFRLTIIDDNNSDILQNAFIPLRIP
jgi:hypothetical protein